MLSFLNPVRRIALTAGFLAFSFVAAFAQAPQIAVPTPGGGNGGNQGSSYAGCYMVSQNLYGPYRMSFCLNRGGNGSYQVTGGGLYCNGQLNWSDRFGDARISLQYSWCGNRTGWTADTIVCSAPRQYRSTRSTRRVRIPAGRSTRASRAANGTSRKSRSPFPTRRLRRKTCAAPTIRQCAAIRRCRSRHSASTTEQARRPRPAFSGPGDSGA